MENMIRKTMLIIILFTTGCLIILASYCKSREKTEEKKEAEIKLKIEQNISEMVKKYNADANWEKNLGSDNLSGNIYTIDIQKALVRDNEKPILFFGPITDIKKHNNEYIAYFDKWSEYDFVMQEPYAAVLFVLNCTEEQVKKILNQPTSFLSENYAVIASISDIKKSAFKLSSFPFNDESASIEVESPEVYIATGICLDLLFVDDIKNLN